MTEYQTFDGTVEPVAWGERTYTVLAIPDQVVEALGDTKRVEGEIADHPVNLSLSKSPVMPQTFLWTGKTLLEKIGIEPGQIVEVRLRPASYGDVDVPEDVIAAVRGAGQIEAWDALTPGKKRGLIWQITSAKRAETRAKRIAKMVSAL